MNVNANNILIKKNAGHELVYGFDERRNRGEDVHKEREINPDDDSYRELIREETGEIIHTVEEKLSNHFGHGSDKLPKNLSGVIKGLEFRTSVIRQVGHALLSTHASNS